MVGRRERWGGASGGAAQVVGRRKWWTAQVVDSASGGRRKWWGARVVGGDRDGGLVALLGAGNKKAQPQAALLEGFLGYVALRSGPRGLGPQD